MILRLTLIPSLALVIGLLGCSSSSSSSSSGGASCVTSPDCTSGVCVTVGSASACTPTCSASANECGGEASCQGVGSVGINVCAPPPASAAAPKPEEQPKLPCKSDAECNTLQAGSICATWRGERDCTITCASDDACRLPAVGGVSIDFMKCQTDEGNSARQACLPRAECFTNPSSCISINTPGVPSDFDAGF